VGAAPESPPAASIAGAALPGEQASDANANANNSDAAGRGVPTLFAAIELIRAVSHFSRWIMMVAGDTAIIAE
jgi:hypothetical protein